VNLREANGVSERSSMAIPRHVAVIMDGNGRWAKARGLQRTDGHREGVKSTRVIVEAAGELGIKVLTLYTFSTENWKRPQDEVNALMELLAATVHEQLDDLMAKNVRLQVIGRLEDMAPAARDGVAYGMLKTSGNTGLILNLALSYGSRREIMDAAAALVREGKSEFSEDEFASHLYTAGLPDPDLLIRTSGEMRLSNFLLWQLAYAEIVVTDTLWPDFRKQQFLEAIKEYGRRNRRFGAIAEARE
jgi:undecaprenyl diphosphate synthase